MVLITVDAPLEVENLDGSHRQLTQADITGPAGPVGPQGPGGGGSTLTFSFLAASTEWDIPHNLGRYPPVWTQDSAGTAIVGDVNYVDANNITVTWTFPQGGTAYVDA